MGMESEEEWYSVWSYSDYRPRNACKAMGGRSTSIFRQEILECADVSNSEEDGTGVLDALERER